MLNFSSLNSGKNEASASLPRVQLLNPVLEYQIFQYNMQTYLQSISSNSLRKLSSFDLLKSDVPKEKKQEKEKDLSIDFSNLHKQFELTLNTKFENPLCKCKYFSLKVYLRPLQQFVLPANEKVELQVLVYTEDGALITKNMKGKDILRGNYIQSLSYFAMEGIHIAYFRIQITEVSSHFIGKTVNIKIKPKTTEFLDNLGWRIKSFYVRNVTIKAKDNKIKI
jgi:hypothetical protein